MTVAGGKTATSVQWRYRNNVDACTGGSTFAGSASDPLTSPVWSCGNPTYYIFAAVTFSDGTTLELRTPAK